MTFTEKFYTARKLALNGKTTTERGEEKILAALDWLYRWGNSSPSVVDQCAQTKGRGLSAKLVKNGLGKSTKTACGSGFKNVPAQMLTLTKEGLRVIESRSERLIRYEIDPYKIRQDQLRHYQIAQILTMQAMNAGKIIKFETEKEITKISAYEVKQPDVIWTLENQQRIGVEIELTGKWGRASDHQISSCINALTPSDNGASALDYILFYSDSPAIIKRYKEAFEPGKTYAKWVKNSQGYWAIESKLEIPNWVKGKVICKKI